MSSFLTELLHGELDELIHANMRQTAWQIQMSHITLASAHGAAGQRMAPGTNQQSDTELSQSC